MRVHHGVPDAGLGGEVHDVAESDDIEELGEELGVVDVTFDDEDAMCFEEGLACAFQGRVVIVVEVVEANDAVAAALEGYGDVRAYEAGGAGDEDGEAAVALDLGGGAELLLPVDAAPGGGEVAAAGVDEALEAEVGCGEGDEEQSPEKHGACGGKATVDLAVHVVRSIPLELPWGRREQLLLQ
ncbi:uncharacterized protein DS421_1g22270 [Arachis hypogaea]|uniref:Uncharacterized protein n=1 Tax=Arachis hypogaea TaxID=3818 RepID=A0A445ENH4_ARAHY|nr:uncharacterized protein DS421_1g22270 [Arachis hypogaea]RYR76912.1 hypothetical protein Ahy_A01g001422 [Arachis hypogaea]